MAVNAKFRHDGDAIPYIPASAVLAGAVVLLGDLIAVARDPIAASTLGSLGIVGVFDIIKSGSTGPVFAVGDVVLWDTVNGVAVRVTSASDVGTRGCIAIGTCTEAAATGDAFVTTRLNPQSIPAALQGKIWEDISISSGSKTLDAQDSGKVINIVAGSAANVITLPATAAGYLFTIRAALGAHATTSLITVSPNASDKIMGPDLAGVDDKDRILASTVVVMGDYIQLFGDGANGYFVNAERGAWTAQS